MVGQSVTQSTLKCMAGFAIVIVAVGGLSLALSSCLVVPYPTVAEADPFDDAWIAPIEIGKTTPEDAIAIFGRPFHAFRNGLMQEFPRNRQVGFWYYSDSGGAEAPIYQSQSLILFYNDSGKVSQFKILKLSTWTVLSGTHPLPNGASYRVYAPSNYGATLDKGYRLSIYAPPEQDAVAKQFAPASDRAMVYIQHNSSNSLWLDGKFVGSGFGDGYFCWNTKPGRHEIAAYRGDVSTVSIPLAVDLAPGSINLFDVVSRRPTTQESARGGADRVMELIPRHDEAVFDEIRSKHLILDALPFPMPEEL